MTIWFSITHSLKYYKMRVKIFKERKLEFDGRNKYIVFIFYAAPLVLWLFYFKHFHPLLRLELGRIPPPYTPTTYAHSQFNIFWRSKVWFSGRLLASSSFLFVLTLIMLQIPCYKFMNSFFSSLFQLFVLRYLFSRFIVLYLFLFFLFISVIL